MKPKKKHLTSSPKFNCECRFFYIKKFQIHSKIGLFTKNKRIKSKTCIHKMKLKVFETEKKQISVRTFRASTMICCCVVKWTVLSCCMQSCWNFVIKTIRKWNEWMDKWNRENQRKLHNRSLFNTHARNQFVLFDSSTTLLLRFKQYSTSTEITNKWSDSTFTRLPHSVQIKWLDLRKD